MIFKREKRTYSGKASRKWSIRRVTMPWRTCQGKQECMEAATILIEADPIDRSGMVRLYRCEKHAEYTAKKYALEVPPK